MITREQFEAHVRAEAAKAYPFASAVGSMLSSRAIHRLEEFDDKAELRREAYIAARMEYEWPLVEALDQCRAVLNLHTSIVTRRPTEREYEDALGVAYDALSPYTTKPIEP